MEEMPSQNMPARRLKLAILPLDLFALLYDRNHSGEILATGKLNKKMPDGLFPVLF
jgi:hypothetical protein